MGSSPGIYIQVVRAAAHSVGHCRTQPLAGSYVTRACIDVWLGQCEQMMSVLHCLLSVCRTCDTPSAGWAVSDAEPRWHACSFSCRDQKQPVRDKLAHMLC